MTHEGVNLTEAANIVVNTADDMGTANPKHITFSSAALYSLLLGDRSGTDGAFIPSSSVILRSCRSGAFPSSQPSPAPSHRNRPTRRQHCCLSSATRARFSPHLNTVAMSSSTPWRNLVTVQQAIEAHRSSAGSTKDIPRNVFVDGSWYMPAGNAPRNGREEYIAGPRIPEAYYFDIDDVAPVPGEVSNPKGLPHMRPSPQLFARAMDKMGISPDDIVYVYAAEGCGMYHRAYWTFMSCGYHDPDKVKLMQGSLDEWKERGGDLEYGELAKDDVRVFQMGNVDTEDTIPKYACWRDNGRDSVVDLEQVLTVVEGETSDTIIVDARSSGRFYGKEPEPRPGLRGGHMPGAANVPFTSLLEPDDPTKFKPMEEVKDIFVKAGIAPLDEEGSVPRKIVCSCGSGVTAAALAVGLEMCGLRNRDDIFIYDGSWIEWGGDSRTPIATTD